jgi:hypothetical protein
VVSTKNPIFVESGLRGARQRWGEQRTVRLDQLEPSVAVAVRALIAADEAAKAAKKASSDG